MHQHILLATAALASGLGIGGVAADPTWGGFYVDGAIGARSTTTDFKTTSRSTFRYSSSFVDYSLTDVSESTGDHGSTNFLGQLSAGWRWDNDQIVAGIGLFVDLAGDDAGNLSSSYASRYSYGIESYPLTSGVSRTELKQTNRYGVSIDIAPSWRTHPYLKLAYAWSNMELSGISSDCRLSDSFDETFSGFGIGGGVRHLYNDNLYFFAEVMWQELGAEYWNRAPLCGTDRPLEPGESYSETRETKVEPTNLTGVLGVGWKF